MAFKQWQDFKTERKLNNMNKQRCFWSFSFHVEIYALRNYVKYVFSYLRRAKRYTFYCCLDILTYLELREHWNFASGKLHENSGNFARESLVKSKILRTADITGDLSNDPRRKPHDNSRKFTWNSHVTFLSFSMCYFLCPQEFFAFWKINFWGRFKMILGETTVRSRLFIAPFMVLLSNLANRENKIGNSSVEMKWEQKIFWSHDLFNQ